MKKFPSILSILLTFSFVQAGIEERLQLPADGAPGDGFGNAVSINGNQAVIGAHKDDGKAGSAYIYENSPEGWSEAARLEAGDREANDEFGYSVSIDGDVVVVGALARNNYTGAAYVFTRHEGEWTQTATLAPDELEPGDCFGMAAAVNGNTIIVAAPGDGDYGSGAGALYVYGRQSGIWTKMAKLYSPDAAEHEYFGFPLAFKNGLVLAGCQYDSDLAPQSGAAYVFAGSASVWSAGYKLTAADHDALDGFGFSVALGNGYCVVGAILDDEAGENAGAAYVFRRTATGWLQEAKLTGIDAQASANFGNAVCASDDFILVGNKFHAANGLDQSGACYLYQRTAGAVELIREITPSDAQKFDLFGYAVAASAEHAIISAYGDDSNGQLAGAVYIYNDYKTNYSPIITSSDTAYFEPEAYFEYQASVYDPDDDPMAFFDSIPEWLDTSGLVISGQAPSGDTEAAFLVIATDYENAESLKVHLLLASGPDSPPTITSPSQALFTEDIHGCYAATATDPDGAPIVRFEQVPDWLTIFETSVCGAPPDGAPSESFLVIAAENRQEDTLRVAVTVAAVNDAPVFRAGDAVTVSEDTGEVIVRGWASDISAGPASEVNQSLWFNLQADNAIFAADPFIDAASGDLSFTPLPNVYGSATVDVQLRDGGGVNNGGVDTSATKSFLISVSAVNDPPRATDDAYFIADGAPLLVDAPGLIANDTDVEHDALYIGGLVARPNAGELSWQSDGAFRFMPADGYAGIVMFSYIVADPGGGRDTAAVSIQINQPPTGIDDYVELEEDARIQYDEPGLLANDLDQDPVSILRVHEETRHGTVALSPNGAFSYSPKDNFHGSDQCRYILTDGVAFDTVSVFFEVLPVNDPPALFGADTEFQTTEDVALLIRITDLAVEDIDNDPLQVVLLDGDNYSVIDSTFIPMRDYNGSCIVKLFVYDGEAISDTIAVQIEVLPANDRPWAENDHFEGLEDQIMQISAPGVLRNDTDAEPGRLSCAGIVREVVHGTLITHGDGSFSYSPESDFAGKDTFVYVCTDESDGIDTAMAVVHILPVNDPPHAVNDTFYGTEDQRMVIAAPGVLSNDWDVEGDKLIALLVGGVEHGDVSLDAEGNCTYVPVPDWSGVDRFSYVAKDSFAGSDTATVTLKVEPVNDCPSANPDTLHLNEDRALRVEARHFLANDFDKENDSLAVAGIAFDVSHGILDVENERTIVYRPSSNYHGYDRFGYIAVDEQNAKDTAVALLVIQPVDDPPTLAPLSDTTMMRGCVFAHTLEAADPDDNDTLRFEYVQGPRGVIIDELTGLLEWRASIAGRFQITVSVTDKSGLSDTAAFHITVEGSDDTGVRQSRLSGKPQRELLRIAAGPNPVQSGKERVCFMIPRGFKKCKLILFNAVGDALYSKEHDLFAQEASIFWDCRMHNGRPVAAGNYLAVISLYGRDGEKTSVRIPLGVKAP